MEVKVIQPMFHQGKPVEPGEVIDIASIADVQYLVGIGRVAEIDDSEPPAKAKPAGKKPAKVVDPAEKTD